MTATPICRCDPSAPFGDRVASVAVSALAFGTLSESRLAERYRRFIACGQAEDLSRVRTSCGIFVRACLHWAGRPDTASGASHVGGALVGHPSWTGLATSDLSWRPMALAAAHATPGSVFWRSAPDHVGVLLARLQDDVWATAEGGGGAGTECKITWRKLDDSFPHLQGIWVPELMAGVGAPPAPPTLAAPLPVLRLGAPASEATATLRAALGMTPAAGPFDGSVEAAVVKWQNAHGLSPIDGVVGPMTWASLGVVQ